MQRAEAWEVIEDIERECGQCEDPEVRLNRIWKMLAEWRGVELDKQLQPIVAKDY